MPSKKNNGAVFSVTFGAFSKSWNSGLDAGLSQIGIGFVKCSSITKLRYEEKLKIATKRGAVNISQQC